MSIHAKISQTEPTLCFTLHYDQGIGRLGISVPGVGYAVERGEIIARKNDYQLIE